MKSIIHYEELLCGLSLYNAIHNMHINIPWGQLYQKVHTSFVVSLFVLTSWQFVTSQLQTTFKKILYLPLLSVPKK